MSIELLTTEYAGAVTASTVALIFRSCQRELRATLGGPPSEEAVTELTRRRLTDRIAGWVRSAGQA